MTVGMSSQEEKTTYSLLKTEEDFMSESRLWVAGSNLEIENARNLTMRQLSRTFIPTAMFNRLLSRKHHILLGARGQGKTALFRMLAFEGLSALAEIDAEIKKIVDAKKFVGMYLPTKLEWVQSLSLQTGEKGISPCDAFTWKLNLSSCLSFLSAARACLDYYVSSQTDRILSERKFCKGVSAEWKLGVDCGTVDEVERRLKKIGYEWQVAVSLKMINAKCSSGQEYEQAFGAFLTKSFIPVRRGMDLLGDLLGFPPETAWLVCIDEAEYMTEEHQKIINSFMRVAPENLFLKIATMPFSHYTLETDRSGTPVVPSHDFEYLHMDEGLIDFRGEHARSATAEDELGEEELKFGDRLLQKVIQEYYGSKIAASATLQTMFGRSKLLDGPIKTDWGTGSANMKMLKRYASPALIARAEKLLKEKTKTKFLNEVGRKVREALVLVDDERTCTGNKQSDVYSGAKMIVACADGNPRLMIRILNNIFAGDVSGAMNGKIAPRKQNKILCALAKNLLNQIKSFQGVGPTLFDVVMKIGVCLRNELHGKQLTSDPVFSVWIKEPPSDDSIKMRTIIQTAIKYGVFKPNDTTKINYGAESTLEGAYHLSYIFCPYFRTLPRKGKAMSYSAILNRNPANRSKGTKQLVFDFGGGLA